MKKFLFLFFNLFNCFILIAQTNYPTGTSGCIARWTFDQDETFQSTIKDASGNNHHGTNVNILNGSSWRGIPNHSGSFNGNSSKSEVLGSSQLSPNTISIITLIKFNNFYSGDCQGNNIIYKGLNYNGNQDWSFFVSELDNNCTTFNPNLEKLHFITPNFTYYAPSSNYILPNQWYFLAITFDGISIHHYQILMDPIIKSTGIQPLYTQPCTVGIGNGSYDVTIGATINPPFPFWLHGDIDELVIFNRALSSSEVEQVYDYLWGIGAPNTVTQTEKNSIQLISHNKFIHINNSNSIHKIQLRSIDGKLLKVFNSPNSKFLDCSDLASQLVIVTINFQDKSFESQKIILQ